MDIHCDTVLCLQLAINDTRVAFISLAGGAPYLISRQLEVERNVTLSGGAHGASIGTAPEASTRLLRVGIRATLRLESLNLFGGAPSDSDDEFGLGGSVLNHGVLLMHNCSISGARATMGGAVFSSGRTIGKPESQPLRHDYWRDVWCFVAANCPRHALMWVCRR